MPDTHPIILSDCRHFRGSIPCAPHKAEGVHCADCVYYEAIDKQILIIKLGATGDVIRTTPLLHRLRADHPHAKIWWLTESPDVVPAIVDVVLPFTLASLITLRGVNFDLLYNLDKDFHACALATELHATVKKGFVLKDNAVAPADKDALDKFVTGIFDDVSLANTKSYPEELFAMCGYVFAGEKYVLDVRESAGREWNLSTGSDVIGLNTGSGDRWTSRLWSDKEWAALATGLMSDGCTVVLLGGPAEHSRNTALAEATGATYFGYFPMPTFLHLMSKCTLIVTGVTMALHAAIALEKKIVVMNNIFNKHEFDLYGLGELVEPELPCLCYFRPTCTNPDYKCMEHFPASRVLDAVRRVRKG